MDAQVYDAARDIDFDHRDLPYRFLHQGVLMVHPAEFAVDEAREDNPFMRPQPIDSARAREEWEAVRDTYDDLGFTTYTLDPVGGLSDMVFTANQSLPFISERYVEPRSQVILSNMDSPQRQPEVEHVEAWYDEQGYDVFRIDPEYSFGGTGDAIWHPDRTLLWGGIGPRTDRGVYDEVVSICQSPVVTLEPEEPWTFLDMCFSPLDQDTALVQPDAFARDDLDKIYAVFDETIEVPYAENNTGMACNAHSPNGDDVLIDRENTRTIAELEDRGFTVHELETDEFRKSGGSVFSLKTMVPD